MSSALAAVFPHAIAVALSPMPIAALILILLSKKAKINSFIFLFGWMLGLILTVGIVAFLFDQEPTVVPGQKNLVAMWFNLILGILLVFLAFKQVQSRPKHGEIAKTPGWLTQIENISPIKTLGIALLLITINAKNTVLDISAGVTIAHLTQSFSETFIVILIYTIVASISIIIPCFAFLLLGNKMTNILIEVKSWFIQNNAVILFVLFLILGVSLISKAFGG